MPTFARERVINARPATKVFRGLLDGNIHVVIKDVMSRPDLPDSAESEVAINEQLSHLKIAPRLILVHREDSSCVTMVFEAAQDDLFNVVQHDSWTFRDRLTWARDICLHVSKMHQESVAHLDLCLENCVLWWDNSAKLIDFGIACTFNKREKYHINIGKTSRYDRKPFGRTGYGLPALFERQPVNAFAADTYSLGILLFNLLSKCCLYEDFGDEHFRRFQKNGIESVIARWPKTTPVVHTDEFRRALVCIKQLLTRTCTPHDAYLFYEEMLK